MVTQLKHVDLESIGFSCYSTFCRWMYAKCRSGIRPAAAD